VVSETDLLVKLEQSIPPVQLRYFMITLTQLCYVQRVDGGYKIGSRLLGNWLQFHDPAASSSQVSDRAAIALASDQEAQHLMQLIAAHKSRLKVLEIQAAQDGRAVEPSVANEIEDIRTMIVMRERELARLQGHR
jgi:hypothetical protein